MSNQVFNKISCCFHLLQFSSEDIFYRFDFESFSMASQQIGTAAATGGTNVGSVVGGCKTDQFSIDGPKAGSPVICGTNTGQHSEKTFISDDVAKTP